MAAIATVGSFGSPWWIPGAVALVMAIAGSLLEHRNRPLGAAIGALSVASLSHMGDIGFHGLASLLALIAVAPVLWSAYERCSRDDRRLIRRVATVTAVVLAAIGVTGLIAAMSARSQLSRAASNTRTGLHAVRDADQDLAVSRFTSAEGTFDSAGRTLSAPWVQPARLVPVLSQHISAMSAVADSGETLAAAGATAARDAPYHDLTTAQGRVDVEALASMQAPVAASLDALRAAQARLELGRSRWLTPPVRSAFDEFKSEIDDAVPSVELAAEGLGVMPEMLGADGIRRYLVLFTNPAETRFFGGFVGAYGVIKADRGQISLERSGSIDELNELADGTTRDLSEFDQFMLRYGRYFPERYFQNVTASPDMPTNAAVARELYRQTTGQSIDGVMAIDPIAIEALLKITGPVHVEGVDEVLTAKNAADYLLHEQYLTEQTNRSQRTDRLAAAAHATFEALIEGELPGPQKLGNILGPAMHQGRLAFSVFDVAEEHFLSRVGITGDFMSETASDYLSVRTSNANPNKIDTFLDRSISYDASYDPTTGAVKATATVKLTNHAPDTGLPRYVIGNDRDKPEGSNTTYMSLYTPLQVTSATVDGQPTGVEPQSEFGGPVYSLLVTIPSDATVTVSFSLEGAVTAGESYSLDVLSQPIVNEDRLEVSLSTPVPDVIIREGDGLDTDGTRAGFTGSIDRSRRFAARFASR